ncbi:MAG: ribosome-associated translation inhibitor RaiA [Rhodospirillales bacterium]|nr:ribosome-associated translation inhibitor RaiA [Rhodospirillales bacterium]
MQITVQGKQMDLGDALRTHVTDKLDEINHKYFNHATDATVTFSKEGHGHSATKAHISIRIGKDIMVMADNIAGDPYGAFDTAAEKVAKQMRRYKKRLRDHHDRLEKSPEAESMKARDYVLEATPEDHDESEDSVPHGKDPVVVAELTTAIQTMSVSEAVMRLDLSGQTAMLFRNASHSGLNMVYRRADGNIGWVDPEGNGNSAANAA